MSRNFLEMFLTRCEMTDEQAGVFCPGTFPPQQRPSVFSPIIYSTTTRYSAQREVEFQRVLKM